jgi:hypothetical protein
MGLTVETLASSLFRSVPPGPVEDEVESVVICAPPGCLWLAKRDRVLAALRERGLDPIVLKGGALVHGPLCAPSSARIR